jgi:hypothetical protein
MLPGIGEKIVSDTCDTMIRMADSLGYEGWTHDRIQQAMVELAKDDDV